MATSLLLRRPGAASMFLGFSLLASSAAAQPATPTAPPTEPTAVAPPPAATPPATAEDADGADEVGDLPVPARAAPPRKAGGVAVDGAPSGDAAADELPPTASDRDREPAWQREEAVRRSGFTIGLAGGLSLGSSAGYPNNVQKIGFERYYTETGVGVGTGGFLWLGGAITDWFTFGVGFGGHNLTAGKYATSMAGFIFHTEVFPLFSLGGPWRETGIIVDTGTGGASTTSEDTGDEKIIDGALPAKIGGGVFYEGFRLWKVSTGPWLYADYSWSGSVREPGFYLGWRTVLYAGPRKPKR